MVGVEARQTKGNCGAEPAKPGRTPIPAIDTLSRKGKWSNNPALRLRRAWPMVTYGLGTMPCRTADVLLADRDQQGKRCAYVEEAG